MEPQTVGIYSNRRRGMDSCSPWPLCKFPSLILLGLAMSGLAITTTQAQQLPQLSQQVEQAHQQSQQLQQQIDQRSAETLAAQAEYERLQQALELGQAYSEQLQKRLRQQQQELVDVQTQLDSLAGSQQALLPLLLKMEKSLARSLAVDIPFQQQERQQRLTDLQQSLWQADISLAEQYRLVLDAYRFEVDLSRQFSAWQGVLEQQQQQRQVNYLRLGRLGWYYQTLDGQHSGYWQAGQGWQPLPAEFNAAISQGLKVAWQQASPELLKLPLANHQEVSQ